MQWGERIWFQSCLRYHDDEDSNYGVIYLIFITIHNNVPSVILQSSSSSSSWSSSKFTTIIHHDHHQNSPPSIIIIIFIIITITITLPLVGTRNFRKVRPSDPSAGAISCISPDVSLIIRRMIIMVMIKRVMKTTIHPISPSIYLSIHPYSQAFIYLSNSHSFKNSFILLSNSHSPFLLFSRSTTALEYSLGTVTSTTSKGSHRTPSTVYIYSSVSCRHEIDQWLYVCM